MLLAYYAMIKYERKKERKQVRSGYTNISDKNSYNEKFTFLENQEISASALWDYLHFYILFYIPKHI